LISGTLDRRRRALFWSTIASAIIHCILIAAFSYVAVRLFIMRGHKEVVSQTEIVTIKKAVLPTPAPLRRPVHPVRQRESAPAMVPRREIAKTTALPAPPQPPRLIRSAPSKIERDESGFAREVAQLNAQNDPHAIPTIDPASREASSKAYAFNVPSSLRGEEHGNGIITPVQSWHQGGEDCYYGRYEYTYPDGAMESGNILWPFCYDPGADPFRQPPHPIPFPLPLLGYKLPADAQLPPIEKQVYDAWAAGNASAPQ
jgi:hypothetical protein